MEVVKELKPLAGGSMGSGGGRKKPPTTPNDRDNSSGADRQRQGWESYRDAQRWDSSSSNERYLSPRQDHFSKGHTESKANNYYEQLGGY